MKECSVSGCTAKHKAKGFCSKHYQRWTRLGKTVLNTRERGSGALSGGYLSIKVDGRYVKEHRYIMEQHIGRKLEPQEVVHHINRDKLDNRIENLRLLSSAAEHNYVHQCEDAMEACGHHHWRKCWICKEYDEPGNLYFSPSSPNSRGYHKACMSLVQQNRYRRKKDEAVDSSEEGFAL